MNILKLGKNGTLKANLTADFDTDGNADSTRAFVPEEYGWIARHLDDVIFGFSILLVLFLIASVIAIACYTIT